MSIKCKACGGDMDMVEVDEESGTLEILCNTCIKAASDAYRTNEWDFEGLFWEHDIFRRGTPIC